MIIRGSCRSRAKRCIRAGLDFCRSSFDLADISGVGILCSSKNLMDLLLIGIDITLRESRTVGNGQSIGVEFCITRGNRLDTRDVVSQLEGDFAICGCRDNLISRTAECSGFIHGIGPGNTIVTAVPHSQIGRDLTVVHLDIVSMDIAVGCAVRYRDTAVRRFYRGAPCIDAGLGSQAGDLDGLRRTIGVLIIHHIQRYRAIAVNGIGPVMGRTVTYQMIVAEAVFLQNRVQVQIHRAAAQSGHGHMVGFRTYGSTGNVVILQAGNGGFGAIIHGQGCTACHSCFSMSVHIGCRTGRNLRILQASDRRSQSVVPRKSSRTIAVGLVGDLAARDIFILCLRDATQVGQFQRLRFTIIPFEGDFLVGSIFRNSRIIIGQGSGSRVSVLIVQCQCNSIAVRRGFGCCTRSIELVVCCIDLDGPIVVNLYRRIRTSRKADAICKACRLAGAVSAVFQIRSSDRKSLKRTVRIRFRRNGHITAARYIDSIYCLLLDSIIGYIELDGAIVAHRCRRIGTIGKDKAVFQMNRLLLSICCLHSQIIDVDRIDILIIIASCLRNRCHVRAVSHLRRCFRGSSSQFTLRSTVQIAQRQVLCFPIISCKGDRMGGAVLGNSGICILEASRSDRIAVYIRQCQDHIVFIPGCRRYRPQLVVGGIDSHCAICIDGRRGIVTILEVDAPGQFHGGISCAVGFHCQIVYSNGVIRMAICSRCGIGSNIYVAVLAGGQCRSRFLDLAVVGSIGIIRPCQDVFNLLAIGADAVTGKLRAACDGQAVGVERAATGGDSSCRHSASSQAAIRPQIDILIEFHRQRAIAIGNDADIVIIG